MRTSLGKKNQSEEHSTSKPNRFATIPSHTLVSCTSRAPPPPLKPTLTFDRKLGNTQERFLNEQNHLSYEKLHLCKRLFVLVLLKTRYLVSKFENPTPGAESPFSQQSERFLDNLGRSSTCSSLLAVEFTMVYHHGFQCISNQ